MALKPKDSSPIAKQGQSKSQGPKDGYYAWLSQVEHMCRKAFVPDQVIYDRARARIAARLRPLKGSVDASQLNTWLKRLDEPLPPELERKAEEAGSRGVANRDLLAHRIGRPSTTTKWQGCPTDCYVDGSKAYRKRLEQIGRVLGDLGWLVIYTPPAKEVNMEEKQRNAEKLAAECVGG